MWIDGEPVHLPTSNSGTAPLTLDPLGHGHPLISQELDPVRDEAGPEAAGEGASVAHKRTEWEREGGGDRGTGGQS